MENRLTGNQNSVILMILFFFLNIFENKLLEAIKFCKIMFFCYITTHSVMSTVI